MATVYGNTINGYWRVYLTYTLNNNFAPNKASITCEYGINWVKDVKGNDTSTNYQSSKDRPTYVSCTGQTTQYRYPTWTFTKDNSWAGRRIPYWSGTFYITKTTKSQSITLKALISHASTSALYQGTSQKSVAVSISALPTCTISFDKNTDDSVTQMPDAITKYYDINVKLPPVPKEPEVYALGVGENTTALSVDEDAPQRDGWAFQSWNTQADGLGTSYSAGATYNGNEDATLYAKWGAVDPPICDVENITLTINNNPQTSANVIRDFTTISCHIPEDSIVVNHEDEGRTLDYIAMEVGQTASAHMDSENNIQIMVTSEKDGEGNYLDPDGEYDIKIITSDSAGAVATYVVGKVTVVTPTWEKSVVVSNTDLPPLDKDGNAMMVYAGVMNYTTGEYDEISQIKPEVIRTMGSDEIVAWAFNYVFDTDHVDSATSLNPNVEVKLSYRHYDEYIPTANSAFFTTVRNQNYSNGIYNVMFVGGVDNAQFPDHTSRVWWSKINDPLYFPDTNYIEVGSNDTGVQGLTKVGDYLAVIKQSKTTDTAIFLLFPTSFEEETTYAVKQGVQGVGALAKYSFNILGDETLFLSPKGVMAIVPSEDEEHKVQNRSYFVDKRLLAETGVENAYSFVFDGKYFLSIGNGHCYVLDGNQRNSWGNDRTVLVYECYFLDNVPANCFVKYQNNLVFSNNEDVCVFGDTYTDAYENNAVVKEPVPVKAVWSTIFDDDGSLHYYKTMQKKGNLVSVLPLENETPYKPVTIDAETFNENKEMYFVYDGEKYVQCSENDVFSEETDYFIENRSNTRIYVRKDDNEPVEIQRKFGLQTDTPSEMFLNKKFKKYKRLQFILRNEEDEDFGVDEIVKNYTVGNYAKK